MTKKMKKFLGVSLRLKKNRSMSLGKSTFFRGRPPEFLKTQPISLGDRPKSKQQSPQILKIGLYPQINALQ